jgi:hypothetical protein
MKYVILLLLLPCALLAQGPGGGYRNYRVYGDETGVSCPYCGGSQLNSFSGNEEISTFSSNRLLIGNAANAASRDGKLLFYTNGWTLLDKNGNDIPGGDSLSPTPYSLSDIVNGGNNFPQNSFIFQHSEDSSLYTMVHMTKSDASVNYGPLKVWKSIFKINNDSTISVVQKNVIIVNDTVEFGGITGCKHGNGRDWWVIIKNQFSKNFHTLLFTPDSVYKYLNSVSGIPNFFELSTWIFSPDGQYLASYDNTTGLYIYSFNRCNGQLTLLNNIPNPNGGYLGAGLCFSPNSQYIYFNDLLHIWRMPMQSSLGPADIQLVQNNYQFTDSAIMFAGNYFNMELSNDGRIYIGNSSSFRFFATIANPDAINVSNVGYAHWGAFQIPYFNNRTYNNHAFYTLGQLPGSPCDTLGLTVGKLQIKAPQISIGPNPNNGNFSVNFTEQKISGVLDVYDLNGQVLHSEYVAPWSNTKQVNLQHQLSNGMYALRLSFGEQMGVVKFVVEK